MRTTTARAASSTSGAWPASDNVPARRSGAAAAPHLRRLLAERGVGQRLQRLVERRELARQSQELLVVVEPLADLRELVADPVEPLEEHVESPVGEVGALHAVILG